MKKIIDLHQIGEKIEFNDTRERTQGKRSEGIVTLRAGKSGPPAHIHPSCEEGFEVLNGSLTLIVNGKERTLQKGESVIVQRGEKHTFKNSSQTEPVEAKFWYEPALRLEWMLQTMGEDAMKKGGDWKKVSPLPAMYIMYKLRNEHRLAGMPFWLQNILFGMGAGLAKLTGAHKKINLPG